MLLAAFEFSSGYQRDGVVFFVGPRQPFLYPNAMPLPVLPSAFIEQMRALLGTELPAFLAALDGSPPVSVRSNPAKPWQPLEAMEPVPWCPGAWYLPERPVFTLDPAFHGGAYYVQEAASMLLGAAISQLELPAQGTAWLDVAAAPGGKSTLLASLLPPASLLVANEVIRSRNTILYQNLAKWGHPGVLNTNLDPRELRAIGAVFDLVLVDAPCSGEGMFRKDPGATQEWSPQHVQHCALRQQRILEDCLPLIGAGGYLVYSTCTFNPTENDAQLNWLRQHHDLRPITLSWPAEWGLTATPNGGVQAWPHHLRGEGFFMAILQKQRPPQVEYSSSKGAPAGFWRKTSSAAAGAAIDWLAPNEEYVFLESPHQGLSALPQAAYALAAPWLGRLHHWDPVLVLGEKKHQDFVPGPHLALSTALLPQCPVVSVDAAIARQFLKKDSLDPMLFSPGWNLVKYENYPLGWVKRIQQRINNYFPKDWRIVMDLREH